MEQETCTIDGLSLPLEKAGSVLDLSEMVRNASEQGRCIYPLGGQTMAAWGMPPIRPGVAVDLTGLAKTIDYPARDMTITVEAGMTLSALQEILHHENQRLPVDVPRPDQATVGGALATNTSGPRRFGHGTLRDYVIGISFVNDEGQVVKGGGRVVKNVAGYDLCKLMIGSFGTLGIISQVTFKVLPAPEDHAIVSLGCQAEHLDEILSHLHNSETRPVCIEVLNDSVSARINKQYGQDLPEAPWVVLVGYESNAEAVNWQVQQLIKEIRTGYNLEARIGPTATTLWTALVDLGICPDALYSCKANVLPGEIAHVLIAVAREFPHHYFRAHAGNGILQCHRINTPDNGDIKSPAECKKLVEKIHAASKVANGRVVVSHCPTVWKSDLSVWDTPPEGFQTMRNIKDNLDPKNLFNPGRFVGGI